MSGGARTIVWRARCGAVAHTHQLSIVSCICGVALTRRLPCICIKLPARLDQLLDLRPRARLHVGFQLGQLDLAVTCASQNGEMMAVGWFEVRGPTASMSLAGDVGATSGGREYSGS